MGAQTAHPRTHETPERRSLPPSRDPVHGIRPGNTPRGGPPHSGIETDDKAVYWIVLHCTYEVKPQKEH
jgi:hypothetical protein